MQVDPHLGGRIVTDAKRLQQVLKNLLSNAFKFTSRGGVRLHVSEVPQGWSSSHPVLSQAGRIVSFEVSDTGIGIPPEKQRIVFEAFQQADASTSRRYGGTGLGLAISRELAGLLGGEIHLHSAPGVGSTFTLYLPMKYVGPAVRRPQRRGERRGRDAGSARPSHGPCALAGGAAGGRARTIANAIQPGDATLLIVEDDASYARIMVDLAHETGTEGARGDDRCRGAGAGATLQTRPPCPSTSSCPTCSDGRSSAS